MRHKGWAVLLDSEGHDPQEGGQVPQLLRGQGREQGFELFEGGHHAVEYRKPPALAWLAHRIADRP